jgi:predicted CXXCH cytochrome family protein
MNKKITLLLLLVAICVSVPIVFGQESEYKGAEFCGECHSSEYAGWSKTAHANAAGRNDDGTYWVADPDDPDRNRGDLDAWKDSCAGCHTLNWDGEAKTFEFSETDPEKGLNIQCEECHGPGFESMEVDRSVELCEECHTDTHSQVADYRAIGGHSESYEDLLTSDHAGDSCLHCMTTEGFLGDEVTIDSDLTSITCIVCHNPHEGENDHFLRYEESNELCAQCHLGSHHPQSEEDVYPAGPHAKADVECVNCHGAGEHFAHGHESPWFNHSFGIYGIYYPNNVTEPLACAQCHELEWAIEQYEVVETTTETMVHSAEEIFEAAYTIIEGAGLSEAKATELTEAVDAASDIVHYWVADSSGGLHNPEGGFAAISAAAHAANDAALEALELSSDAMSDVVSGLESEKSSLETQVNTLESKVSDLEAEIEELSAQGGGIPGFPTSSIILGLLISAAALYLVIKPKNYL